MEIQFVGDDAQLMQLYQRQHAEAQKWKKSLFEIKESSRGAAAENRQMMREAKAAIEANLTPLEKYRQTTERLKRQLQEGLLTQEQYNRANTAAHREMTKAKQNTDEYRAAQEKLAEALRDSEKAANDARKADEDLGRAGKAVFEQTRSPLERYNAEVARLSMLKREGKISHDTYTRALRNEQAALRTSTQALTEQQRANSSGMRISQNVVSQLAELAVAYGLTTQAVRFFRDANRESMEAADAAAEKWQQASRKFSIQSGLTGLMGQQSLERMEGIGEQRGVDFTAVSDVATQLVSSGFSATEASGGSLDEFLKILNASSATGKPIDPAATADALAKYLESQGLQKSEANVRRVGRQAQVASKAGQFSFADLTELATVGAPLKDAGMAPEEQIAAMGTLVDVMPSAEAATGLRNVVGRLRTAKAFPRKLEALQQMGVNPEDVDLVGENLDTALGRLQGGLETVAPQDRASVMTKIFEEQGIAAAGVLMQGRGKTRDRMALQQDDSSFLRDVVLGESGVDRGRIRQQYAKERMDRANAQNDQLMQNEMAIQLQNAGAPPVMRKIATAGYQVAREFGASPGVAMQATSFLGGQSAGQIEGLAARRQLSPIAGQQNDQAMQSWAAALKENTAATKENTKEANPGWRQNRTTGVGAARPPEAQLGRSN